jgi:pre-mRNA-splicing factor ATP-dependent RNA helicase DHX38/PRP16
MQCVTSVDGQWLAELGPMFFSLKDSKKSKIESRKKYANDIVAMETEMNEAQAKIEQMKKEKESLFISSRNTLIVTPGRIKAEPNSVKNEPQQTPKSRRFGL